MNIKISFTNNVQLTLEQHRGLNCRNPDVCGFFPVDSRSSADPRFSVDMQNLNPSCSTVHGCGWRSNLSYMQIFAYAGGQHSKPRHYSRLNCTFSTVFVSSFSSLSPWPLLLANELVWIYVCSERSDTNRTDVTKLLLFLFAYNNSYPRNIKQRKRESIMNEAWTSEVNIKYKTGIREIMFLVGIWCPQIYFITAW